MDDNAESGDFLTVFDDEGNKFQAAVTAVGSKVAAHSFPQHTKS